MKHFLSILKISVITLFLFTITSCEDLPPTSYTVEYVVEAYLIVNQPIQNIVISHSLPTTDTFKIENSIVKDARVEITGGGETFMLNYRTTAKGGEYFFPDTTKLIKEKTLYELHVTTNDGRILTGKTITPQQISWIVGKEPKSVYQYPSDTLNLPSDNDSLVFAWTKAEGLSEYLISLQALDTLEYGKYLTPPTPELNRRMGRFYDQTDNPQYKETTLYGFLQGNSSNVVWNAFRWFGKNQLTVYAADDNFNRWSKSRWVGNQYDENLGSIKGGVGVFGSASIATQPIFLLKNKPIK
jgi:hypothetical protein